MPTDAHPDVVTMAKPLANGYPIGAVLMRDSIAEPMTAGVFSTLFCFLPKNLEIAGVGELVWE